MKNKKAIALIVLLLVTSLCLVPLGCDTFSASPIIGKWQSEASGQITIEFTNNGDYILKSEEGFLQTNKYELVGSDVVKLTGDSDNILSLWTGTVAVEYSINGSTMQMGGMLNGTWKRVVRG